MSKEMDQLSKFTLNQEIKYTVVPGTMKWHPGTISFPWNGETIGILDEKGNTILLDTKEMGLTPSEIQDSIRPNRSKS